jgi:hypothetical protein
VYADDVELSGEIVFAIQKEKKKSAGYLLDASTEVGLEVGLYAEKSKCMCNRIQCKAIT